MKSELKEMLIKHEEEIDNLRKSCKHPPRSIKIRKDGSCVGAGSLYPSVIVTCTNCGTQKIVFDLDSKKAKTVKKTLKRQQRESTCILSLKNGDSQKLVSMRIPTVRNAKRIKKLKQLVAGGCP